MLFPIHRSVCVHEPQATFSDATGFRFLATPLASETIKGIQGRRQVVKHGKTQKKHGGTMEHDFILRQQEETKGVKYRTETNTQMMEDTQKQTGDKAGHHKGRTMIGDKLIGST